MPAFLINPASGHIWTLRYGLTTVGTVGCDINVNDELADRQHAVIQFNETNGDFCIRDLNSSNGLFLNSFNFRNATSPLNHGDSICFSEKGPLFVFCLCQSPNDALWFVHSQFQHSTQLKNDFVLPMIPNLPSAPPQQLTFANDLALKDRWAMQTQGGAWTQIAPIPPPKPPMHNLRGRPSSASSVSRLVRQPAVGMSRGQVTNPGSQSGSHLQAQMGTSESGGYRTTTVSAEVVESIARHLNSRSNSRDSSSVNLNETFNIDIGNNPMGRIAELESENRSLNDQISSLRGDLSSKDVRISSLQLAVDTANDTIREREKQIQDVRNQLEVSSRDLASSKAELEAVERQRGEAGDSHENEVDQLQEKLLTCETENELLKEELESLRKEVESHGSVLSERETELTEKNSTIQDLTNKIEAFDTFLQNLRTELKCGEDSVGFEQVAEVVSQLVSENMDAEQKLNTSLEKLKAIEEEVTLFADKLGALSDCDALSAEIESMDTQTDVAVKLKTSLQEFITSKISTSVEPQSEANQPLADLVLWLKEQGLDVDENSSKDEVQACIEELINQRKSLQDENDSTKASFLSQITEKEQAMEGLREQHESQLESLIANAARQQNELQTLEEAKNELEKKVEELSNSVESSKQQTDEKYNEWRNEIICAHAQEMEQLKSEQESEMAELKKSHSEEIETIQAKVAEKQAEVDELKSRISELESILADKESEISGLVEVRSMLMSENEFFKEDLETLKSEKVQLEEAIKSKDELIEAAAVEQNAEVEQTMKMLKMECQEHAKTIVKLEEKIIALSQENQENIQMRESALAEKQEIIAKYTREKPKIPPKPASITPVRTLDDLHALEQLVVMLRSELSEAKKQLRENEAVIEGLARDLAGANARLADVAGELSESQKEEVERSQSMVRDLDTQLQSVRAQLEQHSCERERWLRENDQFRQDLQSSKQMIDQLKSDLLLKETQVSELNRQLFAQVEANERQIAVQKEQTRIAEELSGMGAQCKGERHVQVMQRQKEALSDLRHRIKLLEQNRPPIPTADQALGQVALLQRELAELKAQQASGISTQDMPGFDIDDEEFMDAETGEVKKGRGKIEAALVKANRIENAEALELSEKSYFSLTKSLARRLCLEGLSGNRTLAHISREEREKLFVEREKDIEQINASVNTLQSRVERKDELLNTYEKDLGKLREMEAIAAQKQKEVLKANADLRAKKEEIEFIREALKRTKEDYEREKRLNVAIKSKKGDFLEQFERQSRSGLKGHNCAPEDLLGKEAKKKREENEKLKKKAYEVDRLKELLKERENQIAELSVKIVNYESTAEAH